MGFYLPLRNATAGQFGDLAPLEQALLAHLDEESGSLTVAFPFDILIGSLNGGYQIMNRREFMSVSTAATILSAAGPSAGDKAQDQGQSNEQARKKPVKAYSRFALLPQGNIAPSNWLLQYARINADNWILDYARRRDPGVYAEYSRRSNHPQPVFNEHDETIDFCGYIAYFGSALIHYAQLLPDSKVAQEADPWVQSVLAAQDSDGYLGGFAPEARWQHWLEIWSLALVLDALLYRYEAAGEHCLLNASERAAQAVMKAWHEPPAKFEKSVFSGEGILFVATLCKLYGFTGKEAYLSFARELLRQCGKTQAYLSGGDAAVHNHAVIEADNVPAPAVVYEYAGDPELLKASEAGWQMMLHYISVDGTPHGNEMMFNIGSRANSEHCGAVNWMVANQVLTRMTGNTKYADAAERAMFNGYPAGKSPDGQMVGYMHSPNQLVATEWSNPHDNDGDLDWWASRQHFSTAHEPLCCNSNGPRAIPFYVESMILRAEDGLAVAHYGPCKVNTTLPNVGRVTLTMDTAYPFEDEVRVEVEPERPASFGLRFRIPGWCVAASLEVNGTRSQPNPQPGAFATLQRRWEPGDKITLQFQNQVRLVWRRKTEFHLRVQCAAVERGPLVFALPVQEDWQSFTAPAHGPGQDIKSYRLLPKAGAVWNYALIVDRDHPERSLSLRKLSVPDNAQPWGVHPPVGLEVKARRVLNWQMEGDSQHPKTPGFPFNPMKLADEVETVTLVPYGATRLRMAFLPIVAG